MVAGDEESSTPGGSSGENEGTAGSAVPRKGPKPPPNKSSTSAKTEQKLNDPSNRGGE